MDKIYRKNAGSETLPRSSVKLHAPSMAALGGAALREEIMEGDEEILRATNPYVHTGPTD
jgi:hypothetical protein